MITAPISSDNIIDFILDLFSRRGAEEYMGEAVSMAQHMEQSAACAVADGADDALIVAALLHDIGHFVGDFPIDSLEIGIDNYHEEAGAQFLTPFFPSSVTEPIRLHVAAKKYLCAVDKSYFERLSDASKQSLQVQGGPMNEADIHEFESNPHHQSAVKLRYYDDEGKVSGLDIKSIDQYREKLETLLVRS